MTLNTLLMDPELPEFLDTLETVAESGADAAIVQDLAAAKLVREHCPELELHASTQMAIHNVYGAQKMEDLGFSRAALARELSLSEISENLPQDFAGRRSVCTRRAVHVRLGHVLSFFSFGREEAGTADSARSPAGLNFRSAGRPVCAFPQGYVPYFCDSPELTEAGVQSFKIEGRMKRPEYVGGGGSGLPHGDGRRDAGSCRFAGGVFPQRVYGRLFARRAFAFHVRPPHAGGCCRGGGCAFQACGRVSGGDAENSGSDAADAGTRRACPAAGF